MFTRLWVIIQWRQNERLALSSFPKHEVFLRIKDCKIKGVLVRLLQCKACNEIYFESDEQITKALE